MKRSVRGNTKPRGRPKSTGIGAQIGMRWHAPDLAAIDEWRRQQPDLPTRSKAIRRLVEIALASTQPQKPTSKKSAADASGMAGRQIDNLGDKSATVDERAKRKRRLLKGPSEFRDMRKDTSKPRG
jgi:hypothetical protein